MESEQSAMSYLKENKEKVSKTQYLTLKDQILSGNTDAVMPFNFDLIIGMVVLWLVVGFLLCC